MESQPIRPTKHSQHSRVLEQHDADRMKRSETAVEASKKAVKRAQEVMEDCQHAAHARRPAKH